MRSLPGWTFTLADDDGEGPVRASSEPGSA